MTPALAHLFDQWEAAHDECRRLVDIDDEARDAYFRTAPPIPASIAAPVDDEGFVLRGFKDVWHVSRSRQAGPKSGTFVLKPSHWHNLGDKERERIAADFLAADRAAREAAG